MQRLVHAEQQRLIDDLERTAKTADEYADKAVADNTRRAYASDWKSFQAYCDRHNLQSLPAAPQTVALYFTAHRDLNPRTLERRYRGICFQHREHGLEPPDHPHMRKVLKGIKRELGRPAEGKDPITEIEIYKVLSAVERRPDTSKTRNPDVERNIRRVAHLQTMRNRAIILLGFSGAFRRSELVALNVADLKRTPRGFAILIRRSKTDKTGEGRIKNIPYHPEESLCPVRAVDTWLAIAGITDGAVFRNLRKDGTVLDRLAGKAVATIVKNAALGAGLDPKLFAAHSLRSGFDTAAADKGVPLPDIAAVSHQSETTILRYWKSARQRETPPLLRIFDTHTATSKTERND